jgi:TatA/E family protein of Tat protein translocase
MEIPRILQVVRHPTFVCGAEIAVLACGVMSPLFALGMPGLQEWVLILLIVLILFGAKRLPELARGLGQSVNEFRKAKDEFDRELQKTSTAATTTPEKPAVPAPEEPQKPA